MKSLYSLILALGLGLSLVACDEGPEQVAEPGEENGVEQEGMIMEDSPAVEGSEETEATPNVVNPPGTEEPPGTQTEQPETQQ